MPCSPRSIRPSVPIVIATRRLLPDGPKNETRLARVEGHIVRAPRFEGGLYRGLVELQPPDPPLSDGVVTLRQWTLDDVPAIAAACADQEIARWIHQLPSPYRESDAREYVLSTEAAWRDCLGAFFAVVEHASGAVVGSASGAVVGSIAMHVLDRELANVEVGYWTAAPARGRGLTTRAVRLLSGWAVDEAGAKRVQLRADVLNGASLRVAEKAGFTREGTLRASGFNNRENRRVDYAVFSLLPGEGS
ncbi:MAG: GNAT family N-acetyltransferase [Actinobacteria bacterium]|nr:MAG: GNAT family N-acetyltransferase [Actinomycetota bacterium]